MRGTIREAKITISKRKIKTNKIVSSKTIDVIITELDGKLFDPEHILKRATYYSFGVVPSKSKDHSYFIKDVKINFEKDFGQTNFDLNDISR